MTGRHVIALGLAVAVAAALLAGVDDYGLRLLTLAAIYAIAVLGYQLALGHAGVLSLAQGAFFGVGAYVSDFPPPPMAGTGRRPWPPAR